MKQSKHTILTLDAGGTNLVFNAVDEQNAVISSSTLPAPSVNLDEFLRKLLAGFHTINKNSGSNAKAISFCFPGIRNGSLPNSYGQHGRYSYGCSL